MKKILTMGIVGLSLMNMSLASAQYIEGETQSIQGDGIMTTMAVSESVNTYATADEFLAAEGKLCTTATDGINVITVENGEFGVSTEAFTMNPEYSCTNYKLSTNDMGLYNHTKNQIDESYVTKVEAAVSQYEKRIKMLRWSDEMRREQHLEMIEKVETMISKMLMKYPQDSGLPERAHEVYMKLTLIKFELMLLDM